MMEESKELERAVDECLDYIEAQKKPFGKATDGCPEYDCSIRDFFDDIIFDFYEEALKNLLLPNAHKAILAMIVNDFYQNGRLSLDYSFFMELLVKEAYNRQWDKIHPSKLKFIIHKGIHLEED